MDTNRFDEDTRLLLDMEEDSKRPAKKGIGRRILFVVVLAGLSYATYYAWGHWGKPAAADATATQPAGGNGGRGGGRGGRGGFGRPAVITVTARKTDMPVYLRGLGTASAYNTVTVRPRVDGQVIRIAFREGQVVEKGDLLAEIDRRPFEVQLAQAKGQLARDQAMLQSAKVEQQRNQLLMEKGLIPRQQADIQTATVAQFEGAIQSDQAQIDNANLQITYSHVVAPITGQIGLRLIDEGNIVRAADPNGMVVITQLQPISVLFNIPEDNLGEVLRKLRAGQQLRVEAWDHDDSKKIADGILLTADNQIDATTGTSKLKAIFDNKNNGLSPNQFVNVRLLIDTLSGAVVIPSSTVQRGSQGTFVYVVDENQTAQLKMVTIKSTEGNNVAIGSGLEAGDMVILEGMDKVQDGARVDVQTSGQTPEDAPGRRGGGGGREGRGGGRGRGQRNGG
jgi:multidrug efflux system membrane fusion protein